MKGAFLIGDGRGSRTRTNGLDIESTIPSTESPDEATYKGNLSPVLYLSRSSGLVSEVSLGGADSAAGRTTETQAAETMDEQVWCKYQRRSSAFPGQAGQ